jgi:hypothetical protein
MNRARMRTLLAFAVSTTVPAQPTASPDPAHLELRGDGMADDSVAQAVAAAAGRAAAAALARAVASSAR